MDVWCVAKPGLRAAQEEQIPMTDGLTELFVSFAAGDPEKAANTAQVIFVGCVGPRSQRAGSLKRSKDADCIC